jgi:hypothetical protein
VRSSAATALNAACSMLFWLFLLLLRALLLHVAQPAQPPQRLPAAVTF